MAMFNKKKETATATDTAKPETKSMKELYSEKPASKEASKAKTKAKANGQAFRVLVKPLITEKAAVLNGLHKYAFMVSTSANKISVAEAIEEVYGVKPVKVNILNMSGKVKTRGRINGKRKDWRKAIVTLPKGSSLDVYEGV